MTIRWTQKLTLITTGGVVLLGAIVWLAALATDRAAPRSGDSARTRDATADTGRAAHAATAIAAPPISRVELAQAGFAVPDKLIQVRRIAPPRVRPAPDYAQLEQRLHPPDQSKRPAMRVDPRRRGSDGVAASAAR